MTKILLPLSIMRVVAVLAFAARCLRRLGICAGSHRDLRYRLWIGVQISSRILLVCLPCCLPPTAQAAVYSNGTATATFTVSLTLLANCTIAAAPLNFGNNGVLSVPINQQSNLTVTCTNTTPYNVGLDAGTVSGSTISSRLMAGTATGNTGTTVPFQLYQDTTRLTVWGNTQGTNTVAGTGTGAAQTLTVYGQVPVDATTPKPDTYQTIVTATVYF